MPSRLDDGIRRRRQEAVDEVRAGDGFRLPATVAPELGPDAAESEQRSIVIERKPHHVLFAGRWIGLWRVLRRIFASRKYDPDQ